MLKLIFVALVVLAVLSDAQSLKDGEDKASAQDGMTPETKATPKTEEMVKSVEKQVLSLLKLNGTQDQTLRAISFRTKKTRTGWFNIIKVGLQVANTVSSLLLGIAENTVTRKASPYVLEGIKPLVTRSQSIKYFEPNLQDYQKKEQ